MELNPEVPWVADSQGRLLDFSARWLELTGRTRRQALKEGWTDVAHPDDLPGMQAAWAHALATGDPLDVEHRLRVADGSFRWMRTRAFSQRDPQGKIAHWYGFTEDIDARVRAEAALLASEARYRTIIDTAQEGVWMVDAHYRTTFVNVRMAQMLGYACHEMIGRPVFDFLDERERAVMERRIQERETGQSGNYDGRYRCKDGSDIWVIVSATPLTDGAGRFAGAVALMMDITDRKRLEIQQARLAAIVDSSDDAILSKTLEGIITSWNQGAERIFGYTAQEAVGRPKTLVFPPELYHEEDEILARLRRGERIDHFESVRVRKDGRRIDVSLTISPIKDGQGVIVGASTIARDITETRRQQQELAELNKRLRGAMRETHHRVKNNLQVIAAILDMVLLDHPHAVPANEVKRIAQQVVTLASIHDILTREAESVNEAETLLSAQEVLHRLLTLLERTAHRYHLHHEVEDIRLTLRQVTALALAVNELVLNAMKHGQGQVQVSLRREGQRARLVVEDEGPGLPPSFDPQTAAHTGLLLVTALTQTDLEGDLTFENRVEGGARVSLTMPIPPPHSR